MYLNNSKEISADLVSDPHLASWKHKKLVEQIRKFEADLDQNHEIAIRLASFGTSILMAVEDVGYQNPGKVNGEEAQLIQHTSQLNFLLLAVQKPDPQKPPRRIGFALPTED